MVVYTLMQSETGMVYFIHLSCIFDVVCDFVVDNTCRRDESAPAQTFNVTHAGILSHGSIPRGHRQGLLLNCMCVSSKIIESA